MQKVFYIIPRIFSVVNHNIESIAVAFILRLYSKFPFIAHFFSFQDPRYVSIVLQKKQMSLRQAWVYLALNFILFFSLARFSRFSPEKGKGKGSELWILLPFWHSSFHFSSILIYICFQVGFCFRKLQRNCWRCISWKDSIKTENGM